MTTEVLTPENTFLWTSHLKDTSLMSQNLSNQKKNIHNDRKVTSSGDLPCTISLKKLQ